MGSLVVSLAYSINLLITEKIPGLEQMQSDRRLKSLIALQVVLQRKNSTRSKDRELDRRLQEALQAIEAYWRLYGAQGTTECYTGSEKIEHNTQAIHDLQKQLKELTDLLRPIR